jgi:DNA recombination protein RmuC
MDTYIFLVIGLAVGVLVGWLLGSRRTSADPVSQALLRAEQERALRAEKELGELRETARLEAEQDSKLLAELAPLREKLGEMQAKVTELEKERTEQFTTIQEQIRNQQAIDSQLRNTTAVLANALTNNQTRGGWGETRLEDIVVSAGLVKGVHYETQFETVNHDDVKIRPDMVIMIPDAKYVAVDSKAPMASYLKAQEEREKGIDANKDVIKQYMKQHITDVKKHIQDLAKKDYWSGLENSPEFTLLFIPSEPVLAATLDEENLMEYAFQNRVALVSPVSLFAVLKTVAYTWRQNSDEKVIHDIINLGTALYREVRIIGEKYKKLGGHLDAVVDDYNSLLGNLDKSFLKPARDLNSASQNRLGIEPIPEPKVIEDGTKRPSSPELTEGNSDTE